MSPYYLWLPSSTSTKLSKLFSLVYIDLIKQKIGTLNTIPIVVLKRGQCQLCIHSALSAEVDSKCDYGMVKVWNMI